MAENENPETPETPEVPESNPAEAAFKAKEEKLLAEIHKWKSQAKDLSSKSQAEKEALLKEQGRWQELAEVKAKRVEELEEKDVKRTEAFISEKKYSAVREAALKAGILPTAISDLDLVKLDSVQVETTSTGRVQVLGVEGAIENLKLSRPHWFGAARTKIGGDNPTVVPEGGLVTVKELAKLSDEAAKTGDYTAYKAATQKFQRQK